MSINKMLFGFNIALAMKRVFYILIVSFVFSCQSHKNYGDKAIFRYNVSEGITSLDPAFASILGNISATNQLFNGLVQTDTALNIQPCIAKNWEILDSGKLYRFHLRTDVYYHKHKVFGKDSLRVATAHDFIFAFNRLIDPQLISPGKWVMNEVSRKEDGSLKMQALNDSTLDIHLQRAFPPFLGIMSMQYCSVVPEEVVKQLGADFRSQPIGTGPFRFQFWKENSKLIYLKNEHYFEQDAQGNRLPFLDAISISFIKDQEVTFLKFLKKEIDLMRGLKGSYKDELLNSRGELRDKYADRVDFATTPYLNTEYLGFLMEEQEGNPLNNKYMRRAINFGFDRQKMLTYLRNGIGTAAEQGFVPSGLPSFTKELKGFSFQPDSVQSLLARAGYPNGKNLKPIVLSTTAEYLDLCEYLQSELANFGIPIKIDVNQAATNNQLIANSKLAFFRKSWVADYPDAENYLSLFRSQNFAPNGPNYTHYYNEQYDQWYQEAMNTTIDSLRLELYQKMDSCIVADAPIIPLFYDQVVRFSQPNISGLNMNPMNLLVLKHTKKSANDK